MKISNTKRTHSRRCVLAADRFMVGAGRRKAADGSVPIAASAIARRVHRMRAPR
ncbi:hypothetical protein [Variovorax sp. UC122_21]|uniref:hypothetical protein n=1 Tax=Variovorax sp. UC122_21 TaxID=3374554 RepID=UPI0037575084